MVLLLVLARAMLLKVARVPLVKVCRLRLAYLPPTCPLLPLGVGSLFPWYSPVIWLSKV